MFSNMTFHDLRCPIKKERQIELGGKCWLLCKQFEQMGFFSMPHTTTQFEFGNASKWLLWAILREMEMERKLHSSCLFGKPFEK